jgi:hypothetical protein
VYNHKRHGLHKLGNREFDFRIKSHFPKKATEDFLLVDLVNNLDRLAEDQDGVLKRIAKRVNVHGVAIGALDLGNSLNDRAGQYGKR